MKKRIKLGLPKGSLQESTFNILKKAGFKVTVSSRSYFPRIDDEEIDPVLLRAQEIPRYVENGVLDCGITGADWVLENNAKVTVVSELKYAKQSLQPVCWVLAVPVNSSVKSVKDLQGKRLATELVKVTQQYLKKNGVKADVEFSWGATEVKVPDLVDAIVELTETGSSLKANNLRIVETVCESTTQLIVNREAWKDSWKKDKIENIALLMKGAINAEDKVGLKLNCNEKDLKKVLAILPSMKNPTISQLSRAGWFAVEIIGEEKVLRNLIPPLKRAGAEAIIEYNLTKVVP